MVNLHRKLSRQEPEHRINIYVLDRLIKSVKTPSYFFDLMETDILEVSACKSNEALIRHLHTNKSLDFEFQKLLGNQKDETAPEKERLVDEGSKQENDTSKLLFKTFPNDLEFCNFIEQENIKLDICICSDDQCICQKQIRSKESFEVIKALNIKNDLKTRLLEDSKNINTILVHCK